MRETLFQDDLIIVEERLYCEERMRTLPYFFPKLITTTGHEVYLKNDKYPRSIVHSEYWKVAFQEGKKQLDRFKRKGYVQKKGSGLMNRSENRLTYDQLILPSD